MDVQRISHVHVEISSKCNKQVTSKQQTRFSLTSINYSSKTTVVFGTAMTILKIGISFPTLVDRREKALHGSIAREFHSKGHQRCDETREVILPQETNSIIGR
jgi:hypothetical protein